MTGQAPAPLVRVNRDRLWDSLNELARVGAYDDVSTGLRGVRRLSLTDEDATARRLVIRWMREAGLIVRVDRIGNVYGRRPGTDDSLPCVLLGSHIDTVATGGAFDGTLGVLGGIEVVRTLNEHGLTTPRPVEVGFFTEEEGVRFGTDMLGSAVTSGRLTLDYALKLTDDGGASVAGELARTGFDGPEAERRPVPFAYLECHIEQGPVLASAGVDVGIVTGVQAISWQRLDIAGEAGHAGTTPMEHRHDAGLAAAAVVLEVRGMCGCGDFGSLRGTVGKLTFAPGQTNVIPAAATMTIDLRNPDDDALIAAEAHLAAFVAGLPRDFGVTGSLERLARTSAVRFDAGVQELLARTAGDLKLPFARVMSGAGHDAQELAAICPTAMIFVAGENGGISHSPREYSNQDACGKGTDLLANAAVRLASLTAVDNAFIL
ncbi:MAG TPA: M20 family metallo-hydrolase [Streptosporangiaceae bacterium]|nr:M20 family metallo-hydrolase [Streptosporangiaceae bacterium]